MTTRSPSRRHRIPALIRLLLSGTRRWLYRSYRLLRSPSQWNLLGAIAVWVVLAIGAFTALGWLWGSGPYSSWQRVFTNWSGNELRGEPLELVKVSLTTIGGIGAVGYLVIKYRERAAIERNEVDAKLLSAVQQLGSDSSQVRIAGVYALADVADTYGSSYHQRVVDILCGYLRTERGHWEPGGADDPQAVKTEANPKPRYVTTDGPVESTILGMLARHLRKSRTDTDSRRQGEQEVEQEVADDQLWCDCKIDLHGAHLTERVRLDRITCRWVNAHGVRFDDYLSMISSTFTESVSFYGATFSGEVRFSRSRFQKFANFNKATFKNYAIFAGASFEGDARFRGIRYEESGYGKFSGARFNIGYWHTDPPIFSVSTPGKSVAELPDGAGWADFSDETPRNIDDPEIWNREDHASS